MARAKKKDNTLWWLAGGAAALGLGWWWLSGEKKGASSGALVSGTGDHQLHKFVKDFIRATTWKEAEVAKHDPTIALLPVDPQLLQSNTNAFMIANAAFHVAQDKNPKLKGKVSNVLVPITGTKTAIQFFYAGGSA